MARAAVKAKQQALAKAQPKTRARGRRGHSGGGNPNQDLFFVRLRRHQKWVYALLAVVFGLSFVLVGVGSGNGGSLQQLWTDIVGGNNNSGSVAKANALVQKHPAQGYRALATAYEGNGDIAAAIIALQSYLAIRKNDAASWAEAGGLELSQGNTYSTQYQNAQQVAQQADPSAPFLPGGTLGSAVGQNPAYQGASQKASSQTSALYQKAVTAFGSAVTDYQKASKLQPRNTSYLQQLANAAASSGNSAAAVAALKKYLQVDPTTPLKPQILKEIKALAPAPPPKVKSGNGH